LTDDICPEDIIRAIDKRDYSGTVELLPRPLLTQKNLKITSDFEIIEYEVQEPVFFKLLLCKELNTEGKPQKCPYDKFRDVFNSPGKRIVRIVGNIVSFIMRNKVRITCRDEKKKLAHVYFGYETPDKVTPNCIVIFVEKKELYKPKNLVQKLENTITWLNIKKDFDFHIVPLGQNNSLIEISSQKRGIEKELKEKINYNRHPEILHTKGGQKTLSIKHKDNRFLIRAS
jgi:hypothetical protein